MEIIVENKKIKLEKANTFLKRLKGFMFKKNINYCLLLKTNSIHTFFINVNCSFDNSSSLHFCNFWISNS